MIKKLFIIFFLFTAAGAQAQTAREFFAQGRKETNPDKQVKLFTKAIEKNPKYAAAYHYRGDAHKALNKKRSAERDYTSAIKLTPKDPYVYYSRGIIYMEQGKYSPAAADFTEVIKYKPDFNAAYLQRGYAYQKLDRNESAVKDLEKYKKTRKRITDPYFFTVLGRAYMGMQKYDLAEQHFNVVIRLAPDKPEGYADKGQIFYKKGKNDEAVSYFSRAINRDPLYAPAWRLRASAFKSMEDCEASAADYTELIKLSPEFVFYNRRGVVYECLENWQAAYEDYSKTVELSPKYAIAYANRAYAELNLRRYEQARKDLETALKLDGTLSFAYVNLAGYYWLAKKDKKNALKNLDNAIKYNFRDFDSLHGEGKKAWMFKGLSNSPEFRLLIYK